jgi:hypothetical protein
MHSPPPQAATLPAPIPGQLTGDPAAIYRALRDQRDVLGEQRSNVEDRRQNMQQEFEQLSQLNPAREGLTKRIQALDARLLELDQQIAKSDAAVATAAAVPGATAEPPRPPRQGPPEEAFVLGGIFMFIVLLPMSIAFARRIWRRSAKTEVTLPPQLVERMDSLERGVEAIALEVERIGEGQRFVTQALTERLDVRALGAGAAQPIAVKQGERLEQRR